ncbi:MAG: protein kinase, partial [Anaerolineae bacterium]
MDNLVGKRLGPYEIVEFIASGGMAEVYKGYHAELDRYVAIKIVGRHLDPDPVFNARFRREAKAIAKLRHPNIVQVFDFGAAEGGHYMVMEFIEGQDLAGYMIEMRSQRRLMEPADLTFLTRQIGLALDHAHSKGVVHRDVKPGNVMLTRAGQAILTDFGLALLNSRSVEDQSSGTAFGTPEYMSPEQVTDSRAATASSDLYSLGVMVFELVTGQLPFTGGSPVETAMRHLNEMPPDPRDINPNVPPSVAAVVLHAMSKDPAERFRTGSHLASALEQAYRSPDKMPILDPPTRPRVEARTEAVGAPAEVVANRGLTVREGRQEKARLEAEHRKLKREARREQAARRRVERRNSRSTFFAAWGRTIFVVLILALLVLAGGYVLQTLGVISVDLGGGGGTPAVAEAEPTSTEADSAAPPAADAGDEATATPTAGPDPTEPATPPTDQPKSTMAPPPTPLQPAQATAVPTISQEPLTLGDDANRIVDGQVMQFVPEGIFQMGTDDPNRNESDRPQHPVRLDAYWLDRTEITNAQYRICVEEGTCPPPSDTSFYDDPDFSQYPVMFVNYDGAASYCLWVAGQTDQVVGLP